MRSVKDAVRVRVEPCVSSNRARIALSFSCSAGLSAVALSVAARQGRRSGGPATASERRARRALQRMDLSFVIFEVFSLS